MSSDDAEVGVSDPLSKALRLPWLTLFLDGWRVAVAAKWELTQYSTRSTAVPYMKYYSTLHEVLEYLLVSTGHRLKHSWLTFNFRLIGCGIRWYRGRGLWPLKAMSGQSFVSSDVASDGIEVGVSDPLKLCRVKDPDTQKRRIENIRRNRRVTCYGCSRARACPVLYTKYCSTFYEVL